MKKMITGLCVAAGVALTFCVWCCIKVSSDADRAMERAQERADAKKKRKTEDTEPELDLSELDWLLEETERLLYAEEEDSCEEKVDFDEKFDMEIQEPEE